MGIKSSNVRRLASAVCLGVLATSLAGCGGSDGEIKEPDLVEGASEGGELTIGISFDQPGIGTAEETGEEDGVTTGENPEGFDVDTATYVAKALGVEEDSITWVKADPGERESLLEEGKVDMVVSSYTITPEREKVVDFAGPYFEAHQDLLIRRNDEELLNPQDLNDRTLCSVDNTTSAENILDKYDKADITLVLYESFSQCVEALADGDVDAVSTDDVILAGFAAESDYKGVLKLMGEEFSDEPYGIAVPEGSTELVDQINAALEQYVDDGSWKASLNKNVADSGYDIPDPPTPGE